MSKWEKVRIDDVCIKKISIVSSKSEDLIDYIDISSIDSKNKRIVDYRTYRLPDAPSRAKQLLENNDIIISTVRPNLNAIAINNIESSNMKVASTGFCVLRCKEAIDVNYLFNFCKSSKFINGLVSVAKGASYPAVSNSQVRNVAIPLPPLEVQKQIASTLDAASELLTMRKQQLAELDELIKSVFYEMFGDPVTNERGWTLSTFGNIGVLNSGGTPSRSNNSYFKGSINWFTAGELNQRYLFNSTEKITQLAIEQSSAKIFKAGSLLIGMYDTAAFKLGILAYDAASNQACANIQINEQFANIEWLYDCAKIMRPHFLSNRRGVRQKNLNLGMIKNLEIPLPPLDLQNQFADIVTKIEDQKALVKQAIDETQQLFDSLMSQYFDD